MVRPIKVLWSLPNTLLGIPLVVLSSVSGGEVRIVDGVIETHGRAVCWLLRRLIPLPGGARALTLGHVVLGRDRAALEATRSHERAHVSQCERWGPLFVPAYLLASLAVLCAGRDPYRDNPFERAARHEASGADPRPIPRSGAVRRGGRSGDRSAS